MQKSLEEYLLKMERANSLTHGIGLVFGLIFIPVLVARAVQSQHDQAIIGSVALGLFTQVCFLAAARRRNA